MRGLRHEVGGRYNIMRNTERAMTTVTIADSLLLYITRATDGGGVCHMEIANRLLNKYSYIHTNF